MGFLNIVSQFLLIQVAFISCDNHFSAEDDFGTIVFANVLFRHGHRTPVSTYPKDPYNNLSYWPEGWGQLTNIGKMQEFELGKWLRKRFLHLLSEIYSRDDILITSTDYDRTLMSAEANLAGLYPPKGSQKWNYELQWQPIPVHTIPLHLDDLLGMGFPCPRYKSEFKKVFSLPAVVDLVASYRSLFDYLTQNTGEKVTSFELVLNIYSNLYIESLHNYTLPEWTKKVFPETLATAAPYQYVLQTYTNTLKKLKSGPLLKDMLKHFQVKLNDGEFEDSEEINEMRKKVVWVYSAHDETIATLLNTLGVFNLINPPFASCVLIELRRKNNDHFVTVSYRNSSADEPLMLAIPGCSQLCPYKKFTQLVSDVIPYDWHEECRVNHIFDLSSEIPYNSLAIFVIMTSTLLVLLLVGSMTIFWQKQRPTRFYRKLKTDSI